MVKKLYSVISLLLAAALCLSFCACESLHKHTYSDSFTYDGEYHYCAATCEHSDEVTDKAPHSIANGKCAVCGYVTHKHTFSGQWTIDGEWHYRAATCEHTDEVFGKALHTYDDFVCTVCGVRQPATAIITDAVKLLAEHNYALTASDVTLRTDNGSVTFDNAQVRFVTDKDGNLQLLGYGEITTADGSGQTVKFASANGVVYGKIIVNGVERVLFVTVDELLTKMGVDVNGIYKLSAELNEQSLLFAQIARYLRNNADGLLPDIQAGEHRFDFDVLRRLNDRLYSYTICQAVDEAAGRQGFYDGIPALYADLLCMSVGNALDELASYGLTVDRIVKIADFAVANFSDGKYGSIDEYLYQQGFFLTPDMTLRQFLTSKTVRMMPFSEVLEAALKQLPVPEGEQPLTAASLGLLLENFVVTYRDQTAYGILSRLSGGLSADEIKQIAAYAINLADARMTVTVTVGADKKLTKLTVVCADTSALPSASDDSQTVADIKAAINKYLTAYVGTIELVGGFQSDIDYSDVLAQVARVYG